MSKKSEIEKEYKKILRNFKTKYIEYEHISQFTLSKEAFEVLLKCIAEIKIKNRYLRKKIKTLKKEQEK